MDTNAYQVELTVEQQKRWSELLAFLDHWGRPVRKGDGLPLARVEEAERRLGFRLPAALREWYLLSGRRSYEVSESKANDMILPEYLSLHEGALSFYDENQSTVDWAIREADLGLDDPPVVIDASAMGH